MDELRFTEREILNYVVLITSSNMPAATRNAMAMAQREGKALGEEGAFYKDTIAITTQGKRETCPK